MSLKLKLLFSISIIIFISYSILGYKSLSNSYNQEYNTLKNDEINLTKGTSKYINEFIYSKIQLIHHTSIQLSKIDFSNKDRIREYIIFIKNSGNFASVYMGFEDGLMMRWTNVDTHASKDSYDPRIRSWYKNANLSKKVGITEPYIDSKTNKTTVSIFAPVIKNGKVVAVLSSDIFIDSIVKTIFNIELPENSYLYVTNKEGKVLIHKDKSKVSKKYNFINKLFKSKNNFLEYTINEKEKLIGGAQISNANWNLIIEMDKETIFQDFYNSVIEYLLIALLFIVLTIILVGTLITKLLKPINILQDGIVDFFEYLKGKRDNVQLLHIETNDEFKSMSEEINKGINSVQESLEKDRIVISNVTNVVNEIIAGSLNNKITATTDNKSIQELVNVINKMMLNLEESINHALDILTQFRENNYTARTTIKCKDEINELMSGIDILGETISTMLKDNHNTGLTLKTSSVNLLNEVGELNETSKQSANSLEDTVQSLSQITNIISDNKQNVQSISEYSEKLNTSANTGRKMAQETTSSMEEINEQVNSINESIIVIEQIAFQTNILSLNAAVEAATAGEAGKGFAVVAQEVRNLATRSAEAAKEIKELVENATNKANEGKKISYEMINGYEDLNTNVSNTLELITKIQNSSNEQQTSIATINDAVSQLELQSKNILTVATSTQVIASETKDIAEKIVNDTNSKKF